VLDQTRNDDVRDAVLSVLCAVDAPLSAEEIRAKLQRHYDIREVRIALRDLAENGDIARHDVNRWSAIAAPPASATAVGHDFTEAELERARQRHGTNGKCPHCGKHGDIDRLFGWRRMRPHDEELQPQSWCIECRRLPGS
jgi:Ribonuclease R winged-helix domain